MSEGPAVPPMAPGQFRAFYAVGYPRLVKGLVVMGATIAEAEDAAQKAMTDLLRRTRSSPPDHPGAWVWQAAVRFFIKERRRDRDRLPREIQGGHLVTGSYVDDRLCRLEDEEDIELILQCLTPTRRQVIKLVMEGLSTKEIGEQLGKRDDNIRQQLKKARDRLVDDPRVASLASRRRQDPRLHGQRPAAEAPEPRKEEVQ